MSVDSAEIVDHEKTEELLDHAEENITALILGTVAYLKSKQLPVDGWVSFLGESVAPSWDEVKGQGARDVARLVALNVIASGGDVTSVTGDDSSATLQCSWPDSEDLTHFGLTREDLDPFIQIYQPITAFLGQSFQAARDGDQTTVTISR